MNTFNLARDMKISAKSAVPAEKTEEPTCPQCSGVGIEDGFGAAYKCRRCGGTGRDKTMIVTASIHPAVKLAEKEGPEEIRIDDPVADPGDAAGDEVKGTQDAAVPESTISVSPSEIIDSSDEVAGTHLPPPEDWNDVKLRHEITWMVSSLFDNQLQDICDHLAEENGIPADKRQPMKDSKGNFITPQAMSYIFDEIKKMDAEKLRRLYYFVRSA